MSNFLLGAATLGAVLVTAAVVWWLRRLRDWDGPT